MVFRCSHGFPMVFLYVSSFSLAFAAEPLSNWRAQVYKDNSDHSLKLIDFGFAKAFKEDRCRWPMPCLRDVTFREPWRNRLTETMEKPKTSSHGICYESLYLHDVYPYWNSKCDGRCESRAIDQHFSIKPELCGMPRPPSPYQKSNIWFLYVLMTSGDETKEIGLSPLNMVIAIGTKC